MSARRITLALLVLSTAGGSVVTANIKLDDGHSLATNADHVSARPKAQHKTSSDTDGQAIFEDHCAVCHGMAGKGGRGPSLNRAQLVRAADDASLKRLIANGIPPEMPEGWFLSDDEIASLARYVRSLGRVPPEPVGGDPVRGRQLYGKRGCSSCHIVAGEGTGYGPELTNVGARRSPAYLRLVMMNPAKLMAQAELRPLDTDATTMPASFLLVEAVTSSGETIRGIRVNEDTFSIQLKDAAGRFYGLRKLNLKEIRKLWGESPMPAYGSVLSSSEIEDLVAYLASLRDKR